LYFIPDGLFLRKYLKFFEELLLHVHERTDSSHDQYSVQLILLESVADSMDYRNLSPSIQTTQSAEEQRTFVRSEATAMNERSRIMKLCEKYKSRDDWLNGLTVLPFADVTYDSQDDDAFHLGFQEMNLQDRTRYNILRVGKFFGGSGSKAQVFILTEDAYIGQESFLLEQTSNIGMMDCGAFIDFLRNKAVVSLASECFWRETQVQCEEEYIRRNFDVNSTSPVDVSSITRHTEYLNDPQVDSGIKDKILFTGKLEVSKANPKEGYVSVVSPKGEKVRYFLTEVKGYFNRAIHGDTVVIEPLPTELWDIPTGKRRLFHGEHSAGFDEEYDPRIRTDKISTNFIGSVPSVVPTARVVAVHYSSFPRRKVIATMLPPIFSNRDDAATIVVPMDFRIPKIRIKTRVPYEKIVNHRLLVDIDGWDLGSNYPHGHFTKVVGPVGDLETEVGL